MHQIDFFSPSLSPPPPYPPPPLLFPKVVGVSIPEIPAEAHNNGGTSSKNLNPSLLVISCILTLVLLVSFTLHLLLRYYCRSSSSSTSDVASTEPHSLRHISSRRVSPEDQKLIDSLPLFSFNSVTGLRHSSTADCAVCLSKFEPHDQLRLLPYCCHAFHSRCIDTWLASSHTCPLCRSSIHGFEPEGSLKFSTSSTGVDSFRLEIGSVSNRGTASDSADVRRSYSMGSFEYVVDSESEVLVGPTHTRGISGCSSSIRNEKDGVSSPANIPAPEQPGSDLAAEVANGRGWLKDYVDRLASSASSSFSSRALSFRISGMGFTGSSRRSEVVVGNSMRSDGIAVGSWDMEGNQYGEEISSFFGWLSGV